MSADFVLTAEFPVSPQNLFDAWLSSKMHAAMTGSPAKIEARPRGKFTAWDGYITGTTLEIIPAKRILQSWRTSEFPTRAKASRLELEFEPIPGGTRLILTHSGLPKDQIEAYRQGWDESYFQPMRAYFGELTKKR